MELVYEVVDKEVPLRYKDSYGMPVIIHIKVLTYVFMVSVISMISTTLYVEDSKHLIISIFAYGGMAI